MPVFDDGFEPFKKKLPSQKIYWNSFTGFTQRTGAGSLISGYIFKVTLEGMP
jgi:hypothetical protein